MPSETVKVMVRVRPQNQREKDRNCSVIVDTDSSNCQITLNNPNESEIQKIFLYDAIFPISCSQQAIYEEGAFPLVDSVIEGYNGTIFAYGQTGCGKTHTMMGDPINEEKRGVIPRAFAHIFGSIESSPTKNFLIRCSYIEIYNEEIHDLIGKDTKNKLDLKENSDKEMFIKDLSMHIVTGINEIEKLMLTGTKNRSVGETAMNKDSSRSHSIFTIYIEASENDGQGGQRITAGKLNLVDLAGSERQSKTGATGDRLKEANKINLSLSALGNVISALVDGRSSHIPYRDSKLTRLLQDSLGGNTKTLMIANISPSSENYDETLGTLRYASRAKNIKNQPKVNEDPKDALLREYAEEIKKLKLMLENGGPTTPNINLSSANHTNENLRPINKKDIMDDSVEYESPNSKPKKNKNKNGSDNEFNENEQKLKEEIFDERRKREQLENLLKEMEQKLTRGGTLPTGNLEENKKNKDISGKLKKQKKKEEQLMHEKQQKEEEILNIEKKYDSLQEEVEELRKIIKRLRKKYKDATREIKDLEKEHELNREDLLDTIRLQEKDIKINQSIIQNLLNSEEIEKIKGKAKWHDDKNEFIIPPFILKNKKVKFPKLPGAQGIFRY